MPLTPNMMKGALQLASVLLFAWRTLQSVSQPGHFLETFNLEKCASFAGLREFGCYLWFMHKEGCLRVFA